jgi:signal transduction histidine kinase/DNA-binding response OmpR family regulator
MDEPTAALELSPHELNAFESHRVAQNVLALKTGILITLLIQVPFMFYEWAAIRDHFWTIQILRVAFVGPAIVVGLTLDSSASLQRRVDFLTFSIFTACAAFIIAAAFLDEGYASPYSYVLVMMLVGVGFVTLWPWKLALLFSLTVYGLYWIPIAIGMGGIEDMSDFVGYQLFISGMIVVIIVSQQLRLRLEKRAFLGRLQLQEAKTSLEHTNERLRELDQMKTDFFANVSHELRTPLTLSLGALQSLLKMEHATDEEQHLHALHRNQLRLLGLINQLLDLAKVESGGSQAEYSRQDVVALIRTIVSVVENAAQSKGLEIKLITPSEPVWLYVDREKLEQVMLNLLSNAFKFTDRGGRIAVSVREGNDSTQISVSDTGVGIAEGKLHTIFDRFVQADGSETRSYAGTGIGLALVKSHVELHGGTIDVDSEQGRGTTFTISVPRGKAHLAPEEVRVATGPATTTSLKAHQLADFQVEPEEELEPEHPADDAREAQADAGATAEDTDWLPSLMELNGAKPRVLVVDDIPDMRRYLSSLLNADYEVRTAKDGAEGLRETKAWDPDLVVSDVMMPVMSGADMCQAIKRGGGRLSRTPVVLVTARAEEQTKLRGLDYGADDYLLKPFLQDELLLRVRNLVTKRRQERALFGAHLTLRAQHKYIQSDLELARDFQNDLLSELDMPAPLTAHVEFRPADVVGGDFYHLTSLGPSRVRLFVADMVDHGVKAAVRAAAAWPEYTGLDHPNLGPAAVLEKLNDVATSKYADLSGSFLCLDLDVGAGDQVSIRYAQAGEMPFTIVSEAGPATPPSAEGFMIGLFPKMNYQSRELTITPGSRLFLYSDGLYTQPIDAGRTFREAGLKEAWKMTTECRDIRAATEAVVESFDRFRGASAQLDDVTLIGIEVGEGR